MVFSSTVFLFIFLPAVFLLNYILPKRARNFLLLFASLFFYAWGEPLFVLIMLFSIFVNYILALVIKQCRQDRTKRLTLITAVVFNLLMLIVFKYTNFIIDNINHLLGTAIHVVEIRLPIGISFFTFQAMSYVIDVFRGRTQAQRKLTHLALYIAFFPQLIAGPIVKYHDIARQIESRSPSIEQVALGIRRFLTGLSKKLLIANVLGQVADRIFAMEILSINMSIAWVGAIAYTFQIYFDFSGYSDMAIGLGHLFGFHILENFNYPFIAVGIKDFWRRWHISLSTWFREYLYIPLGGNRRGLVRTCLNMSIVFLCTGLWHGAEWTFVLWGLFHGFFLILETFQVVIPEKFRNKGWGHLYTLLVVIVGFTLFRTETIGYGMAFIRTMFTGFSFNAQTAGTLREIFSPLVTVTFLIAAAASLPLCSYISLRMPKSGRLSHAAGAAGYMATFVMLLLCVMALSSSTYNPFIYFRF